MHRYLAKRLEGSGLAVEAAEFAPGRPSLVARLAGRSNDAPFCFTGHVDVVPLGGRPWSQAPFGGDIVDGKLYGRGSSDMKAGVAAFVEAACEIAGESPLGPQRAHSCRKNRGGNRMRGRLRPCQAWGCAGPGEPCSSSPNRPRIRT